MDDGFGCAARRFGADAATHRDCIFTFKETEGMAGGLLYAGVPGLDQRGDLAVQSGDNGYISCRQIRDPCRANSRFLTGPSARFGMTELAARALYIPVRAEPLYRAAQRRLHGNDFPSQFALGLVGTGEHFLFSHAPCVHGCTWFATQQTASERFIDYSGCEGEYVRQLDCGRRQSGNAGQFVENLLKRKIFAAQNVTLAGLTFFQRSKMSARTHFHVYQIQSSLDIGGEFALEKVDDDAAGGCGFYILFANWCGRVHYHDVHTTAASVEGELFRYELGTLIVADHVGQRHRGIFIGGGGTSPESHSCYPLCVNDFLHVVLSG